MFKFSKIFFILILPLLTGVTMYYIVNAYIEPVNLSASPNTKIDVGESPQNKLGNLSISSSFGTTTISSSSVSLIANSDAYMLIQTTSTNDNQTAYNQEFAKQFAVQFDGNIIPLGFMWKKGNNGGLYIDGGLSIGTTSASNSLTITNGTPSSSIINIGGDASNTIAVGAYYDTIAKVWKVTNPTQQQPPMAIAFDPSGGLWLEAGGTPPSQDGVFYWRNSMHITPNGDVIFSNLYATSSYKIWTDMTIVSSTPSGVSPYSASKYCTTYTSSSNCTTDNGTTTIVGFDASFNVNSNDIDCNTGDTIYFYPVGISSMNKGKYDYVKYTCSVGNNNPVNNTSTVVGGNFFVANQNYTDSILVGNPDPNNYWLDNWATCPDGYLMSGVSLDGVQCSKLNIK